MIWIVRTLKVGVADFINVDAVFHPKLDTKSSNTVQASD